MSTATTDPRELEFRQFAQHDKNLLRLLEDARNHPVRGRNFCAMDAYEKSFKQRVLDMAGYRRAYGGPELLFSPRAYEVVLQVIQNALPRCRGNCGCGESRAAS